MEDLNVFILYSIPTQEASCALEVLDPSRNRDTSLLGLYTFAVMDSSIHWTLATAYFPPKSARTPEEISRWNSY